MLYFFIFDSMKTLFLLKLTLAFLLFIGITSSVDAQNTMVWSSDLPPNDPAYVFNSPTVRYKGDTIEVFGIKKTENKNVVYIVKYNLEGDTISTMEFGKDSVINNDIVDYNFDVFNNLYILNSEEVTEYERKGIIQKYSLDGQLQWVQQMQNPPDSAYQPYRLEIINDTCLFVISGKNGILESDFLEPGLDVLMAFHTNGNLLWERTFNPYTEISTFGTGMVAHQNNLYAFGTRWGGERVLINIDIHNSLTVHADIGVQYPILNVQTTPDNHLMVHSNINYRIAKLNLDGSLIWQQEYATLLPPNVLSDRITELLIDQDGNVFLTGAHHDSTEVNTIFENADFLTIKYDSNGNILWENRYEYGEINGDYANCMLLKNGSIYVGGLTQILEFGQDTDYMVLKINAESGELTGTYSYDTLENNDEEVTSLAVFDDNSVVLTGTINPDINSPTEYFWNTQLLSDIILSSENMEGGADISVFPNPIARGNTLTINGDGIQSMRIISTTGQVIQQKQVLSNSMLSIPIEINYPGMYLLQIQTTSGTITKKIIVQ